MRSASPGLNRPDSVAIRCRITRAGSRRHINKAAQAHAANAFCLDGMAVAPNHFEPVPAGGRDVMQPSEGIERMNRKVRVISGFGLLCAAVAVGNPVRASIPPALSAISSEDFVQLDVDGDGKLSRSEMLRAPGLVLHLDYSPDPNDGVIKTLIAHDRVKSSAANSGDAPLPRQ